MCLLINYEVKLFIWRTYAVVEYAVSWNVYDKMEWKKSNCLYAIADGRKTNTSVDRSLNTEIPNNSQRHRHIASSNPPTNERLNELHTITHSLTSFWEVIKINYSIHVQNTWMLHNPVTQFHKVRTLITHTIRVWK